MALARACTALCLLALAPHASAQTPTAAKPPRLVDVEVGFAGAYKLGCWTPMRVVIAGGSSAVDGQVEVTLPDGDGVPSRFVSQPVRVTPGQQSTVSLTLRFGQVFGELRVALRDLAADRLLLDEEIGDRGSDDPLHVDLPLESDRLLWVTLGAPVPLENATKTLSKAVREKVVVARLKGADAIAQLPTAWHGYEGVEVVVMAVGRGAGGDPFGTLRGNERLEALDRWVHLGGRLVLLVGAAAPGVLGAGAEGHPLARFVPGTFAGMAPLAQLSALEEYVGSEHPLAAGATLSVPRLSAVDRRHVEAREADLPLVLRAPRGLGEVVFVALDPHEPPLSDWEGRGALLRRLLAVDAAAMNAGQRAAENAAYAGYSDMAGQLRGALDQHGRRRVPFALVATLVVAYILLIGPGDYFLVSRLLRRMELTWVTFPIIVLAFSVGAYVAGDRLKGDSLRVNQLDLVDVDAATGTVRTTCWFNLLSPDTRPYDLAAQSVLPEGDERGEALVLGWWGLPGSGVGGMGPRSDQPAGFSRPYTLPADLRRLPDVPIRVWDSKSFVGRGAGRTTLDMQADLVEGANEELLGALANELPVPLEDCLLAHGRWVYTLGTLAPGETRELDALTERSELATQLTGRRLERDANSQQFVQQATPYDVSSADAPSILRMMMFFEAGGGERYTGLVHRYQGYVDLSRRLTQGRAMLVGFTLSPDAPRGQPGVVLLADGRPLAEQWDVAAGGHWTCYRWLLPVRPRQEGP